MIQSHEKIIHINTIINESSLSNFKTELTRKHANANYIQDFNECYTTLQNLD